MFDYLRTHPDYIRAFRHSHCGDEIFFQTLMGISEFAGANTRRPLVFTRWVGEGAPHPEAFGTNDLPRLLQAGTRRRKFRTSSPARSPTTWTSPATGRPSFPGRNSAGFARHAKNAIFAAPETASDF
ncbi:MAG: hypothetical protein ACLUQ6_09425 [Alistipes onderdonkii]